MSAQSTARALAALLACAASAIAPAARAADETPGAAAQVLFDQANALMDAGKFAEACPKLAASQRLDPAGGTLVHLATCHEEEGKLATAWAEFNEALDAARRDKRADREVFSRKHVEALAPRLAHLTITVAPAAASLPGLTIERDGMLVDRELWGTALPVDRGAHVVTATATGHAAWKTSVDVARDGVDTSLVVPALDSAPIDSIAPRSEPGATSWQKPAAIVAFGLGVSGVAIGSVSGLMARSQHREALAGCTLGPAHTGCDRAAVDRETGARATGNFATAMFASGGAAVVAGVVLLLTAPPATKPTTRPQVSFAPDLLGGRAGVLVRGRW